jgi:hypothetical protein
MTTDYINRFPEPKDCNPGTCVIDCKEMLLLVSSESDRTAVWLTLDLSADSYEIRSSKRRKEPKIYEDEIEVYVT